MSDVETGYGLRVHVLAKTPFVPITEAEYHELKAARELIRDALGLEESIHLVLGNFYEYEEGLLRQAFHSLIFTEGNWSEFTGSIHDINRRVVNLLSGARAYLDQTRHFLSQRFGKPSSELDSFSRSCSEEYDSSLGYRAMEALRNYSQHRGLAVHHLKHSHWRSEHEGEPGRWNTIVPGISPARLAADGSFKASVLEELQQLGDPVDIRPLVREYVAALARIHDKVRDRLAADVTAADDLVMSAIERYKREGHDTVLGLSAVRKEGRAYADSIGLFADPIERRKDLTRRTRRVPHIVEAYTTNQPSARRKHSGGSA